MLTFFRQNDVRIADISQSDFKLSLHGVFMRLLI